MAREKLFILKHLHIDGTHTEYVKKADYDEILRQAEKMATVLKGLRCTSRECANDHELPDDLNFSHFDMLAQKAITDWLKFREGK